MRLTERLRRPAAPLLMLTLLTAFTVPADARLLSVEPPSNAKGRVLAEAIK